MVQTLRTCTKLAATLCVAAALLVAPASALAGSPAASAATRAKARALFVAGKKHYAAKRYKQAIAAFEAAGKIKSSPILDFNVARCLDRLKRYGPALARYRAYIAKRPKAKNRADVEKRIAALAVLAAAKKDPYEDLEQKKATPAGKGAAIKTVTPKVSGAPLPIGKVEAIGTDHGGPAIPPPPAATSATPKPLTAPKVKVAKRSGPAEPAKPKTLPPHEASLPIAMRPPAGAQTGKRAGATAASVKARTAAKARTVASARPGKAASAARRGRSGKPADSPKAEGPLYKQWWFWVAIGAGAVITTFIIATLASSPDRTASKGSSLRGGLTVFSF